MIRLLMRGGKKDKALILFFETLEKLLQKKQDLKISAFRRHRTFERNCTSDHLETLGFKNKETVCSSYSFLEIDGQSNAEKKSSPKLRSSKTKIKSKKLSKAFSILSRSLQNVLPYLEVRKVRVSGKTRQVPSTVQKNRQQTVAMRWLIEAARKRQKRNHRFSDALALEFLEAFEKQGGARQKRNELHKIAHGNRTFLRYRWW